MDKKIEINIGELVLHGFAAGDRYKIANAMEIELTRLFTEQGMPGVFSANTGPGRVDAGTFNTGENSRAESIGIQTAQSVYKGLNL